MKIESEAAKASRYGDDALEAFATAVDNGQARLAISILVDIVNTFADKIDALEEAASPVDEIKPEPREVVVEKKEDIKPEPKQKVKEQTSDQA